MESKRAPKRVTFPESLATVPSMGSIRPEAQSSIPPQKISPTAKKMPAASDKSIPATVTWFGETPALTKGRATFSITL